MSDPFGTKSKERAERMEYAQARSNAEVTEGFDQWRKERRAKAAQEERENWLKEKSELGLIHRSSMRRRLTRDELEPTKSLHSTGSELGLLPEEAELYNRLWALNAHIRGYGGIHLYLGDDPKRDSERLEREKLALKKLDRDWSALRATVEHEYLSAARKELEEKHRGESYTLEFLPPKDDHRYPWLSGYWRAVSKEWEFTIEWYDKEGRPMAGISPSMNGAVVSLFREIEEARAKNRIRRRSSQK